MSLKLFRSSRAIFLGSFVSKIIHFSCSLVLAWLLLPEDYGDLILATLLTGFLTQISTLGYELFYLQNKENSTNKLNIFLHVYFLRFITNSCISLILILSGFMIYYFSKENNVSGGIIVMFGISLFIDSFNSPNELFLKNKFNFKKITIARIIKDLMNSICKVLFAALGFGGYSFGIGSIFGTISKLIYYRFSVNYPTTSFKIDKNILKRIFNFGKYVFYGSFGNYLVRYIDKILLVSYFDKISTGIYSFAYSNASIINNYLLLPFGQLNMTYIAKYDKSKIQLFENLSIVSKIYILVSIIPSLFCLIYIDSLFNFIFPPRWNNSIIIIKYFLIFYVFKSIPSAFMNVLTGLGKVKLNSKLINIRLIILLLSLIFVMSINPTIINYVKTYILITLIFDYIKLYLSIKSLKINIIQFVNNTFWDIILILLSMFIIAISFILQVEANKLLIILFINVLFCQLFDKVRFKTAFNFVKKIIFK